MKPMCFKSPLVTNSNNNNNSKIKYRRCVLINKQAIKCTRNISNELTLSAGKMGFAGTFPVTSVLWVVSDYVCML
ncbi:UNVERIFIED_CONTAM: hypothetical protein FKN15_002601 [Acipenser sinensis]